MHGRSQQRALSGAGGAGSGMAALGALRKGVLRVLPPTQEW